MTIFDLGLDPLGGLRWFLARGTKPWPRLGDAFREATGGNCTVPETELPPSAACAELVAESANIVVSANALKSRGSKVRPFHHHKAVQSTTNLSGSVNFLCPRAMSQRIDATSCDRSRYIGRAHFYSSCPQQRVWDRGSEEFFGASPPSVGLASALARAE